MAANNYSCPSCTLCFGGAGALKIHVEAAHLGLRPFQCPDCAYSCAARGTLQMHARRKHKQHGTRAEPQLPPLAKRARRAEAAADTVLQLRLKLVADRCAPTLIVGEADFSFALALTTVHGEEGNHAMANVNHHFYFLWYFVTEYSSYFIVNIYMFVVCGKSSPWRT